MSQEINALLLKYPAYKDVFAHLEQTKRILKEWEEAERTLAEEEQRCKAAQKPECPKEG